MMTTEGQRSRPAPVRPVPKKPFLPGRQVKIRRVGQPEASDLTVYVFYDVAEELVFASRFQPNVTLASLLVGGYYRGPAGLYVEVRGFRHSQIVESSLEFAAFLRRDWDRLQGDEELALAGLIPVGWSLSRPRSKARFGPFELLVQLSYFNRPYHVCLMLDPISRQAGAYRQVADGEIGNVGFNLIEPIANRRLRPSDDADDGDTVRDPQDDAPDEQYEETNEEIDDGDSGPEGA
jgi:hypothetical protein